MAMLKGVTDKLGNQLNDWRSTLWVSLAVAGTLLILIVVIEFLLPREYRTCALMPRFCAKNDKAEKSPFKKLDEGYHGGPKFGLTTGR
jgi:energy-converting hydrogenase Eha subunit F